MLEAAIKRGVRRPPKSEEDAVQAKMKGGKWGTCRGSDLLGVKAFKDDEKPLVKGRFALALPALFAGRRGVGLASVASETAQQAAAKRAAELPLAQKISIGDPVTGKKIKTGPMMAPKNAKAERYKVGLLHSLLFSCVCVCLFVRAC